LRRSQGAVLANVAAGWEEPEQAFWPHDMPVCPDPNALITREVHDWPVAEEARSLAFSFGGRIEDAFGFTGRRFLSRVDPGAGLFDVSRYRS
jgi:hypothetical protein